LSWFAVNEKNSSVRQRRVFISHKSEVPAVREEIVSHLRRLGYTEKDLFAVRLATEEALLNAIEHGNKCDRAKRVSVAYRLDAREAEITVADEGEGFDPNAIPDCTAADNLVKPRGRGVTLIRAFMDTVEFDAKGNRVRLVKSRSAPDALQTDRGKS
jgi:serine/threonine-protein kinase RsbW